VNEMLKVPQFESEAEEAQWWFDNQDLVAEAFDAAANNGTLRRSTLSDRLKRAKASQVPVALDPADATLARELAAKTGESYQDFVRRVVHQALQLEKTA
jgi:hypothetical protein